MASQTTPDPGRPNVCRFLDFWIQISGKRKFRTIPAVIEAHATIIRSHSIYLFEHAEILHLRGFMAITLIHTADWQIGKTFGFVTGDASALLRAQRIKTVQRIAQEATRRAVDAVLVAGDIFETNLIRNETLHSLLQAMSKMAKDSIAVWITCDVVGTSPHQRAGLPKLMLSVTAWIIGWAARL